jgi:hypothetical protein
MRAIYDSVQTGRKVTLEPVERRQRPGLAQEIHVSPHGMPDLTHAAPPSGN